jgi:hypothetical protein
MTIMKKPMIAWSFILKLNLYQKRIRSCPENIQVLPTETASNCPEAEVEDFDKGWMRENERKDFIKDSEIRKTCLDMKDIR